MLKLKQLANPEMGWLFYSEYIGSVILITSYFPIYHNFIP